MLKKVLLCCLLVFVHFSLYAQSYDRLSRDASLALREGRYNDALGYILQIEILLEGNDNLSSYVETMLIKVQALYQLKRYEEALAQGLDLFKQVPQEPRLVQLLGEIYYYLGRGSEALPHFANYIAYSPTGEAVGRTYYYMGEVYLLQGRFQQAEIAFTTAVYHSSNNELWWQRLGYAREQVATTQVGSERIYMLNSARLAYERVIQLNAANNTAKERLNILQRALR